MSDVAILNEFKGDIDTFRKTYYLEKIRVFFRKIKSWFRGETNFFKKYGYDYQQNNLPCFFVLEGCDGSGTTTQLNLVSEVLAAKGYRVIKTNEPNDHLLGEPVIRPALKGLKNSVLRKKLFPFLFALDRAEHVQVIEQTLKDSQYGDVPTIILSDRYFFSSFVYQSLDGAEEGAFKINRKFPLPYCTFFFCMNEDDEDLVFNRLVDRKGKVKEVYETRPFFDKCIDKYNEIFVKYSKTLSINNTGLHLVDCIQPMDVVTREIIEVIERYMEGQRYHRDLQSYKRKKYDLTCDVKTK